MALGNLGRSVDRGDVAPRLQPRRIGAEPHGAAEIAVRAALLERIAPEPFRHQADNRRGSRAELGRIRFLDPA